MTKTQEQYLQETLELKKQNPEMEIHFCVANELSDENDWTSHEIWKVEISEWFCANEEIMTDENTIRDYLEDQADMGLNEEQVKLYVDSRYSNEVVMAICVYTKAK